MAIAGGSGCAAIRGLDEYTTASDAGFAPATDTQASDPSGNPSPDAGADAPGCSTNQECLRIATQASTQSGKPLVPSVCVRATATCQELTSEDCPRLYGDYRDENALVIGTLLGEAGATSLEQAAVLAASEIDDAGGLPGAVGGGRRPLVMVGCDTGADVVRASRHLSETLHAAAVVGPITGEAVIDVTQQVTAKGGMLLVTPTSTVSSIANLADGDLTWRVLPSDAQRATLVIQQMTDLEAVLRSTRALTTVKLGIVNASDARGASARDAITGKLILNGRFLSDAANAANVSLDGYSAGDAAAEQAIAMRYATTFKPDIVFVTSPEQLAELVIPLENALTAGRATARPYYVLTDAARTADLLAAVADGTLPADIKRRVRGIGVRPDAASASVLTDFRAAFATRWGAPPAELEAPLAYDATYAVAYALAATSGTVPTGATVAQGLRALAVGTAATVGKAGLASALSDLGGGKSVSVRGTYGPLQWDPNGDIHGGTIEVWCLGTAAGAPAFGSSGLTMDVATQVVGGAFVQCQ